MPRPLFQFKRIKVNYAGDCLLFSPLVMPTFNDCCTLRWMKNGFPSAFAIFPFSRQTCLNTNFRSIGILDCTRSAESSAMRISCLAFGKTLFPAWCWSLAQHPSNYASDHTEIVCHTHNTRWWSHFPSHCSRGEHCWHLRQPPRRANM